MLPLGSRHACWRLSNRSPGTSCGVKLQVVSTRYVTLDSDAVGDENVAIRGSDTPDTRFGNRPDLLARRGVFDYLHLSDEQRAGRSESSMTELRVNADWKSGQGKRKGRAEARPFTKRVGSNGHAADVLIAGADHPAAGEIRSVVRLAVRSAGHKDGRRRRDSQRCEPTGGGR